MRTAIVCYYADIGNPYLPLMERMTASAKAVMPDAVTLLLTPTPTTECAKFFDEMIPIDKPFKREELCKNRAKSTTSWMMQNPVPPTIFADPDIVFKRPIEFTNGYDVGLMWRDDRPDQPVNTGIVVAQNYRPRFWKHYIEIAMNLPEPLHHWYADQLSYSLLTGVCRKPGDLFMVDDARVQLLDMATHCPTPDLDVPSAWAVHHKGRRKGAGWEKVFK